MFWFGKNSHKRIFNSHLIKSMRIIQKSDMYSYETEIDLKALLFMVADFAAMSSRKDRRKISTPILNSLTDSLPDSKLQFFNERVHFYTSVLKGRHVHGFCMPGIDANDTNMRPITRCAIAFGDCLFNSERIKNYDNEEFDLYSIFDTALFTTEIFVPFTSELTSLFRDIFDKA